MEHVHYSLVIEYFLFALHCNQFWNSWV